MTPAGPAGGGLGRRASSAEEKARRVRARVLDALARRHPRGMTAGQVHQYVAYGRNASSCLELLEGLVAEGLLRRGEVPDRRPFREPRTCVAYFARASGRPDEGPPSRGPDGPDLRPGTGRRGIPGA